MNPFLVQHIAVPFNLLIHFAVCKRTISYQCDMIRIGILIDFKNKHGFLHTFHKKNTCRAGILITAYLFSRDRT